MLILTTVLAVLGASLVCSAISLDDCPGYAATNIVTTATGLTADLNLAGPACNAYGYDLGALKLLVEYQTGMCSESSSTLLTSRLIIPLQKLDSM